MVIDKRANLNIFRGNKEHGMQKLSTEDRIKDLEHSVSAYSHIQDLILDLLGRRLK